MKTARITINRFDGGVTNNPRLPSSRHSQAVANFNVLTDPHRLIPYLSGEDGDSSASTQKIENFCIGLRTGSTYSVFGLGVKSGAATAAVYYRDLSSGMDDDSWSKTANNESSSGAPTTDLFVFYPRTGFIYGARAGSHIWRYDPTASNAWDDTHQALSYNTITQGLVHSKDDILYIGYDNKIAKNNNGSWTTAALTLPTELKVVSLAEYGNYLVISCAPKSGVGKAQVYFWDRDSSLATLSESISWGDESLKVVEEIEGELVGISIANSTTDTFDKITFRRYVAGVGAQTFLEIVTGFSETVGAQLPLAKQKFRGRLYFMMTVTLNGAVRTGVWSIGRSPNTREWVLIHERTSNNDTALNNSHVLKSFYNVGDFLFQAHVDNGTYKMTKTNDQEVYSATSYLETTVNPGIDKDNFFLRKRLKCITAHFEPLPASSEIAIRFRADSTTAWASVPKALSETTAGANFKEVVVNVNGDTFADGRDFEFRVESTGGAVLTGFSYTFELLDSLV